jgi:hypothetical protein
VVGIFRDCEPTTTLSPERSGIIVLAHIEFQHAHISSVRDDGAEPTGGAKKKAITFIE